MARFPFSTSELDLLRREIETLGDQLQSDRLDFQAEIERLKLEVDCIRTAMETFESGFLREYKRKREDLLRGIDSAKDKKAG